MYLIIGNDEGSKGKNCVANCMFQELCDRGILFYSSYFHFSDFPCSRRINKVITMCIRCVQNNILSVQEAATGISDRKRLSAFVALCGGTGMVD
jgi:hypothetical protein